MMQSKAYQGAVIGAVVGGIAAVVMGNKSILNYALVGALLGAGAGYAMKKK